MGDGYPINRRASLPPSSRNTSTLLRPVGGLLIPCYRIGRHGTKDGWRKRRSLGASCFLMVRGESPPGVPQVVGSEGATGGLRERPSATERYPLELPPCRAPLPLPCVTLHPSNRLLFPPAWTRPPRMVAQSAWRDFRGVARKD